MVDASNQQREPTVQMDDTAFGEDMEVPHMDDDQTVEIRCWSGERAAEQTETDGSADLDPWHLLMILTFLSIIKNRDKNDSDTADGLYMDDLNTDDGNSLRESSYTSGDLAASCPAILVRILAIFPCCSGDKKYVTVPRGAGNLADEIEEFISGMRRFYNNIRGEGLSTDTMESLRKLLSGWNVFLQWKDGERGTSAIISAFIIEDVNVFIVWLEQQLDVQWHHDRNAWIMKWLHRWNMFLQARADETPVTGFNLFLTIVGFILYLVDLVSDIAAAIFFASNGQWWQAIVTLAIVYGAIIVRTAVKWRSGEIHCTGAADWLRYVASLLVNWPDLELYGALCRLEWQLHKSGQNARLVAEWDKNRFKVALLKYTEGVCEACPQAILQLYLLVPDLYGDWTWTDYLRIVGASISLCTAGAAFVNMEKYNRIYNYIAVPLSELVVLHMWAVPVTVSRLLSLALLLSVHPYWALAGVALHLVLHGVYWDNDVILTCLDSLQFFLSPFGVDYSIKYRRVVHAIHFLVNTAAMVVWALDTPLECAHPALYTAIICFNAVMFAVGVVGWQLHEKHWLGSYFMQHNR